MPQKQDLIRAAVDFLAEYGVPAFRHDPPRAGEAHVGDAVLDLQIGDECHRYKVLCKTRLDPGTLGALAISARTAATPSLLITDHATPATAERLRQLNIPFVDLAGNAWLEDPPVIVRVEGRKRRPAAPTRHRPFTTSGLKMVFALLCDPDLFRAPLRNIAGISHTTHGTAAAVMRGLRDNGYLVERGRGRGIKRAPRNLPALLGTWAEAYARDLAPKIELRRYAAPADAPSDWWRQVAWNSQHGAVLSGEPAAARWTDYLQPGTLTIYADRLPARLIAQMRLHDDPDGPIEFRKRFWSFTLADAPDEAPPALVYADLLATTNPRCIETAQMIYDQHLARTLQSLRTESPT